MSWNWFKRKALGSVSQEEVTRDLTLRCSVIPALADKCTKQCRAAAYRLIRHALVDSDSVKRLGEQALDWYIVK
jgi:hypothetical protein